MREEWLKLRKGGEFDPPSAQGTILFPGMDGGGEWGGAAFDPSSGLLYVNANEMAWKVKLAERKMPDGEPTTGKALYAALLRVVPPRRPAAARRRSFRRSSASATRRSVDEIASIVREGGGRMPAIRAAARRGAPRDRGLRRERDVSEVRADAPTPFDLKYSLDGYIRFTDPDGFPAITPPWGTLTAIDMNKAAIAWQVPLGEMPGSGAARTPAARTTAARW